ncbi:MAG: phosphatidylserine decarboxylase [Thermoplasmata archaeon]|nr:phosphatidylserine decarboxylase [Thermoplasmata archaeon]
MRLARGSGPPLAAVILSAAILTILAYAIFPIPPSSSGPSSSLLSSLPPLPFIILTVLLWTLASLSVIFFRDPERAVGEGIVSPADGKVCRVSSGPGGTIISIFMNIHNVHVNRAPMDGVITHTRHSPGGHVPAFTKDSERNERYRTVIRGSIGDVEVIQIAGTLARRIVPFVSEGEEVKKGQRIGMIRFGSRVDIILPPEVVSAVKEGSRVLAGTSSIAHVPSAAGREGGRGGD